MTPAERLKLARERRGFISAKRAAEACGIPAPTYMQHESGARGIPPKKAAIYAAAFNVSPEYLLYGTETKTHSTAKVVYLAGAVEDDGVVIPYGARDSRRSAVESPSNVGEIDSALEVTSPIAIGRWMQGSYLFLGAPAEMAATANHGRLCVVATRGRTVVRVVYLQGGVESRCTLVSPISGTPEFDQEVHSVQPVLSILTA